MKKISIIIPVYNGERYLKRCLNSVLSQKDFSASDIELICINDGSSDGSLDILRHYETKYPKIVKVLDQNNSGISTTRNRGMAQATTPYIMFLDQDDWFDKDYCQVFYKIITETNADVVYGGYRRPDEAGRIRLTAPAVPGEYGKYVSVAAWAKIHRASFLKKHNIQFFDNKFGEDSVFTVNEIAAKGKWVHTGYIGYNWFDNSASLSNTGQKGLSENDNRSLIRLLTALAAMDKNVPVPRYLQYYLLRTVVFYLLFSGRSASRTRFMQSYEVLFKWIDDYSARIRIPQRLFITGPWNERLLARFAISMFYIVHKLYLVRLLAWVYCKG